MLLFSLTFYLFCEIHSYFFLEFSFACKSNGILPGFTCRASVDSFTNKIAKNVVICVVISCLLMFYEILWSCSCTITHNHIVRKYDYHFHFCKYLCNFFFLSNRRSSIIQSVLVQFLLFAYHSIGNIFHVAHSDLCPHCVPHHLLCYFCSNFHLSCLQQASGFCCIFYIIRHVIVTFVFFTKYLLRNSVSLIHSAILLALIFIVLPLIPCRSNYILISPNNEISLLLLFRPSAVYISAFSVICSYSIFDKLALPS